MGEPQRAPGTFVVGVTGHRVLTDLAAIRGGVDAALATIGERAGKRRIRVLSALADGAVQLVAERALERGDELWALLPLERSEYAADFATAESRAQFSALLARASRVDELTPARERRAAYTGVGRRIADACNVLLAVWDGPHSQGPGGTSEVVEHARRRGLPVAWVRAGNRLPGREDPTTLGGEQVAVSYEKLEELQA